jgi:ketosteroid isomerase-like protein
VPEDLVSFESGDLAYTVGFERGKVEVDGGPRRPMTIRVTHVYRRIDGVWQLVHRHADFPPADQRQPSR